MRSMGIKKIAKTNLPPVGIELTTVTITGLVVRCLFHFVNQTYVEYHDP